jgi:hypothetical protein
MNTISTIKQNTKTIGFYHKNKPYVIGFKSPRLARSVMYMLDEDPKFLLLKHSPKTMIEPETQVELNIDSEATLFIPKNNSKTIIDSYYINVINFDDFIIYPYTNNIGIIIPYFQVTQDDNEFVFKSHVIDPIIKLDV